MNKYCRQEPNTPVFKLEIFVWLDTAVMAQEILQTMTREAERTRSLVCVEHSNNVDSKITLEPQHVTVSTM